MKNNTKKVLVCLVAGTIAAGVKYGLERMEMEEKRKSRRTKNGENQKKTTEQGQKAEKAGRYIKLEESEERINKNFEQKTQKEHIESDAQCQETVLKKASLAEETELVLSASVESIDGTAPEEEMTEQPAKEVEEEIVKKQEAKETLIETSQQEKELPVDSAGEIVEDTLKKIMRDIEKTDEEQDLKNISEIQETEVLNRVETNSVSTKKDENKFEKTDALSDDVKNIFATVTDQDNNHTKIKSSYLAEEKKEVDKDDLEVAKKLLKQKINWAEAEGVKTAIDYSRLPAAAVLNVSQLTDVEIKSLFTIQKIKDEIFKRIYKKSYKADCILPKSELRYLRMLYFGFDNKTHVGEMIVNRFIAEDIKDIFYLLYQNKYQIERMVLVDEYDADDLISMSANNTSGFNYRKIDGMPVMSKHSRGLAVDINPRFNPYVRTINGEINCQPQNGEMFMDREQVFPHKIDHEDLCYCLFRTYGFTWGGDWDDMKDYQHFQKQC